MQPLLALVLLLNGVQVTLPQPAVMLGGAAWVPLRPVVERLGGQIALAPPGKGLLLTARGSRTTFTYVTDPSRAKGAVVYRVDSTAYVMARPLSELFGGRCHYDAETNALSLTLPWLGATARLTRAELAAAPLAAQGRALSVPGDALPATITNQLLRYPIKDARLLAPPAGIPFVPAAGVPGVDAARSPDVATGVAALLPDGSPLLTGVRPQPPAAAGLSLWLDRGSVPPGGSAILWLPMALGDPRDPQSAGRIEFLSPAGAPLPAAELRLVPLVSDDTGQPSHPWLWTPPVQRPGAVALTWRVRCRLSEGDQWAECSLRVSPDLEAAAQ
jgi:hypothetical protein